MKSIHLDAFEQFAGRKKMLEFIAAACGVCLDKGRLMYWQEKLWLEYAEQMPSAPREPDEILAIFRFCPVHSRSLNPGGNEGPGREIRSTAEYDQACTELFPFATTRLRCSKCEASRANWISENKELCQILRKQITYQEYWRQLFDDTDRYHSMEPAISKRAKKIEAEMTAGDELWEWDSGGWHNLSGRSGIAIVRNGKIVKRWCEIRS